MFIILFYSLMGTFSAIGLVALKSYVGLVPGDALKFFRLGFEAGGLLAALFCFDYILQWSYYIYKYYKEKKWLDEILHDNNRRYDKKAK